MVTRPLRSTVVIVAALALLGGCASRGVGPGIRGSGARGSGLTGVHWSLLHAGRAVAGDGPGPLDVPVPSGAIGRQAWLEFDRGATMLGRDACSVFEADTRLTGSTMTVSNVRMAANGCVGQDAGTEFVRTAVDAMLAGPPLQVSISATRLIISTAGYRLTYRNAGPASPGATGIPTPTATTGG